MNVDDLLDVELLNYDVDESYTISLNADFSKKEMSAFWRKFNALPVYYEKDISIPEGCTLEINLFYVTLDALTIYDSNIAGLMFRMLKLMMLWTFLKLWDLNGKKTESAMTRLKDLTSSTILIKAV